MKAILTILIGAALVHGLASLSFAKGRSLRHSSGKSTAQKNGTGKTRSSGKSKSGKA
jgi:hypothetical protein